MKKADIEKRLREIPESMREANDDLLAQKGLEELKRIHLRPKKNYNKRWIWAVTCCFILIVAAIPLSLSINRKFDDNKYYSADQLKKITYSSIADYNKESGLKLLNLSNFSEVTCQIYLLKETQETAFLEEISEVMTDEFFLSIHMFAVPGKDRFEIFDNYLCEQQLAYNGMQISYEQRKDNEYFFLVKARFEFEGNQYFLDIQSTDQDVLNYCLDQIFS